MNIICDKTLLSAAIDGVSKAVTLRSTIPVLEGILLKAEGFQLTLTGYDLEMGIVTTIDANVKEPGEVVLNAKLLSSMVSRMPSGQINIQSAENGKTTIQSGVAQFEIQSMNPTDFPELPNTGAEETLNIKTGVLRDMIERTLYAVSQDEKKPAHTGELFEISPDKLTVVALDGYRLAIVERPVEAIKEIRIIVPSKTMNEVSHLLAAERVGLTQHFVGDGLQFFGRAAAARDLRHIRLAEDDARFTEGLFLPVAEHRHERRTRAHADHRDARVRVRGESVVIADAAPDRRPLGEDQKILTLVEHLHRGLDGLDILAVALDGKCAERADEPRERAVVEELGLGHKVQMVVERQAQADEHGV